MAAAGHEEEEAQAFTFPPPPFWYKLYAPPADGDVPAKPPPKPPLPRQGTFQVFERMFNTDEPLVPTSPNQMIARRPDGSIDIKGQLLSLSSELLPLFLELVRQLVQNPSSHTAQLSAVSESLEAMQHLSNLLRPQQAAATLEYALQLDVDELKESLSKLHSQVEGVDKQLALAAQALEGASGGGRTGSATTADGHETNALCSGGAMEEDPMNVKQEQI
mmetsp:Transcript_24626/g.67089  ORF Transcript_24626/g.67089 Transcript_24626/m.67089 type:complete len:219 (+) Transcript_24626:56-712(+)|eukprot:CAMPEP_0202357688 /NCGR_PEP_ID=MMETSP1126-20121109/11622_1 /ASSEMBLY_ACC=CAM_ASM_000457 /TAXON_ID=3047 /ORGANISM="Dunaliella tertiolecta, Strain CCMP1320" /LENGTH=218 /DNA_ID=CAMNT_0048950633 /DNA_START=30 /DNA_END=686 /DNA_ORIENTATION=+